MKTRREHILDRVDDLVGRFLYCDRKEDEDLPRGEIEAAVESGEILPAEIADAFRAHLSEALKPSAKCRACLDTGKIRNLGSEGGMRKCIYCTLFSRPT